MKIAAVIVRTLMGLLFLFASITYFFKLVPQPQLTGAMKIFNDGLESSRYVMPTVKVFELLCGLALVTGKFNPLAVVVIFPIIVNIVCINVLLAPEGMPIGIALAAAELFLIYYHRESYRPLLKA